MRTKQVWRERVFWEAAIDQWRTSGLSVAAFCRQRGLPVNTFYAWRRRIKDAPSENTPPFVPVRVIARAHPSASLEVGVAGRTAHPGARRVRRGDVAAAGGGAGVGAMRSLPPTVRILLASEPADLRCGFDGLAARVREVLGADPLSGHLFVFRNRRARWGA